MALESWIETTIGQQVTLQRGIDITKAEQRDGNVPVISSGGVSSYHDTAAVKGPGVVLGRKGVVGSVFYVEEDYWPHDTSLWVKDFHENNPRFVYYFFKSIAPQIARLDVGSANPTLNRNHVHPMAIIWPPLVEQKAIAKALGALDDKIELNRRMNATLEAMARALFQSWFVDFDPVRAKLDGRQPVGMDEATAALFPDGFEESSLGQIPKGWRVSRLEEIASVLMGLSPGGESYNADGIGTPLINGPMEFGDYFPVKTKWTEAATRFSSEGDLIFCVRGSTTGRRVVSDGEYCIGRGVCAIRAKGGYLGFLYQTINVSLDRLLEKATGSVFPSLSSPDIKGLSVLKPSKSILEAYERMTIPIVQQIQKNHYQSRTLNTLRETLLPKLLSGELSVGKLQN
jgi:type I restriction enzyme S subunit